MKVSRTWRRRRTKLEIAPIRRRVLASLFDPFDVAVIVPVVSGLFVLLLLRTKDRRRFERWTELMQSRRFRWSLTLLSVAVRVRSTMRGRTGDRIAKIKLADARTGGPISLRQACIRVAVPICWAELVKPLTRGRFERKSQEVQQRLREIQPEIRALRDEYAGDPVAMNEAASALYGERNINPLASCVPGLVGLALNLAQEAPALWSPLNQGLPDRLAGTVVLLNR